MPSIHDIHVKIGEVKTGRKGDVLRATLGSCVGIAFVWKEKQVMALAHCLLPESPQTSYSIGAKFVDQAVNSLKAMLKIREEDVPNISVFIAGGGNMMSQLAKENMDHVGALNVLAAKKFLKQGGFKFMEIDVGGEEGRQMFIDCTSGVVSVLRLPSLGNKAHIKEGKKNDAK